MSLHSQTHLVSRHAEQSADDRFNMATTNGGKKLVFSSSRRNFKYLFTLLLFLCFSNDTILF